MTTNLKPIIVFGLITFFSIISYAQTSGKAYYKKVKHYNLKTLEKPLSNSIKKTPFSLTFNDSLAIYKKEKSSKTEHALYNVYSGYQGVKYYNFLKERTYREQGKYLITQQFSDYKWELTEEQAIIKGLLCYKAISHLKNKGRRLKSVTAWYTTDICVPAGPEGFGGLPGLIVLLKRNNVTTVLESIAFSIKKLKIEQPPTKEIIMTENEFENFINDIVNNIEGN